MTHPAHDKLAAIVAAHEALTGAVVHAAQLMAGHGRGPFAAHLDRHRAELNVVVGELAMWAESFGEWARVDVGRAIFPPAAADPAASPTAGFEAELRRIRQTLMARRTDVLARLSDSRASLRAAGLPVDQLTTYRRLVRLWAGEAVDLVTEVHRLELADRYLHRLERLSADPEAGTSSQRAGAALLRQWMHQLEAADREGELAFAEVCGYGHFVARYRSECTSGPQKHTRYRR